MESGKYVIIPFVYPRGSVVPSLKCRLMFKPKSVRSSPPNPVNLNSGENLKNRERNSNSFRDFYSSRYYREPVLCPDTMIIQLIRIYSYFSVLFFSPTFQDTRAFFIEFTAWSTASSIFSYGFFRYCMCKRTVNKNPVKWYRKT